MIAGHLDAVGVKTLMVSMSYNEHQQSQNVDVAKKELELLERKLDLEQRTNVSAEDATVGMKQGSLKVT